MMSLSLVSSVPASDALPTMQGYSVQLRESVCMDTIAEALWAAHRDCYCPAETREFDELPAATRNELRRTATLALRMTLPANLTAAYWRAAMDLHTEVHETGDWTALRGRDQAHYWYHAKAAVYGFTRFLMGSTHPQENRAVAQQIDVVHQVRAAEERDRTERALIQTPRI